MADHVSDTDRKLADLERRLNDAERKVGVLEGAQKAIDNRVIQAIRDMKPVSNATIIEAIKDAQQRGLLK